MGHLGTFCPKWDIPPRVGQLVSLANRSQFWLRGDLPYKKTLLSNHFGLVREIFLIFGPPWDNRGSLSRAFPTPAGPYVQPSTIEDVFWEHFWRKKMKNTGNIQFPQAASGFGVLIQIVSCWKSFVADVAAKTLVPMRLNMPSHIFAGYEFTTNLAQTFHASYQNEMPINLYIRTWLKILYKFFLCVPQSVVGPTYDLVPNL